MTLPSYIQRAFEPPTAIASPILREAAAYWLNLVPPKGLPTFGALDPVEMPKEIIPCLWVVDCPNGEATFRFRLAGERIAKVFNHRVRGRPLDDVFETSPPECREAVRARFDHVTRNEMVCYCQGTVYVENGLDGQGERLILPLTDRRADAVTHLLGVTDFAVDKAPRIAPRDPQVAEHYFTPEILAVLCQKSSTL